MRTTMQAVVADGAGGPLRVAAVGVPVAGPDEVLVGVGACGVDRFDVSVRDGLPARVPSLPHILGHEIAGQVVGCGPGVDDSWIGRRVAVSLYLVCARCRWCRSGRETICERFGGHIGVATAGGYAEYVVVPVRNLVAVPDGIDDTEAAISANAIGTAFHALVTRMRLAPGERLVISGAGGGVGLHALQLAVMVGARVFAVDVGGPKLEAMDALGAEEVAEPADDLTDRIRAWAGRDGTDAVLELVGPSSMRYTLPALGKGGRMVIVGSHSGASWAVDPHEIYRREWDILGSRNVSVDELQTVIGLLARRRVRAIIDQVGGLEAAEWFHQRVRSGVVVGRDVLVPVPS